MRTITIILIFLVADRGYGQSIRQTLARADSMAGLDDSTAAALYERALFFEKGIFEKRCITLSLAKTSMRMQAYQKVLTLIKEDDEVYTDSIGHESLLVLVKALMKLGMGNRAGEISRFYAPMVPARASRFHFYHFMAALETDSIEKCMTLAKLYFDSGRAEILNNMLSKYRRNLKSPGIASSFSLVPGMGQLYAGDLRNTANSFLLNAGLGYLLFRLGEKSVPMAVVLGFQLVPRYYFGGIRNAGKSAVCRNNRNKNRLRNRVLDFFANNPIGK